MRHRDAFDVNNDHLWFTDTYFSNVRPFLTYIYKKVFRSLLSVTFFRQVINSYSYDKEVAQEPEVHQM